MLGLSTNLNLIKYLVFKMIKELQGIKSLRSDFKIANV